MSETANSSQTNKPERDPKGFRLDIRRALYEALHPEHPYLLPVEEKPNPVAIRRLRLVFWLESLIGAGCHFDNSDLPISIWEALAYVKSERNRFERLIMEQRSEQSKRDAALKRAQADARKLDKIPGPGQSIFPSRLKKGR